MVCRHPDCLGWSPLFQTLTVDGASSSRREKEDGNYDYNFGTELSLNFVFNVKEGALEEFDYRDKTRGEIDSAIMNFIDNRELYNQNESVFANTGGDSGGPLLCRDKESNKFKLFGIATRSFAARKKNYYPKASTMWHDVSFALPHNCTYRSVWKAE